MKTATLLHILVAVHTLIGVVSMASLFYLPYAAWKRRSPAKDRLLLVALAWPFVNLALLYFNGWECPMQSWAKALSGQHTGWVRDMYWVPESWLKLVPWTYSIGYVAGVALLLWRLRPKKRDSGRRSNRQARP